MNKNVAVYAGEALARYGFGEGHPFSTRRHAAFVDELHRRQLEQKVWLCDPVQATAEEMELFHTRAYVERVMQQSRSGEGFLDGGDTPAFAGMYEAAATVVGTVLDAVAQLVSQRCQRAFVPIAGLHHARRDGAAGFCVFNDCGVAIEALRQRHQVRRIAYVDIDAHHGDGVLYAFEDDPELLIVDLHEDGRFLYPGSGSVTEIGRGAARGTKLNIPMPPGAGDEQFMQVWPRVEAFVRNFAPEFILFQCGADSIDGDPLTHMRYSTAVHAHAAARLCLLADEFAQGRILACGGGGYDLNNLAQAWCAVVAAFIDGEKIV